MGNKLHVLEFGDLDLILKVIATIWMSNFDQKGLSAL